jgi:hypothetical protein
MNNSRPSGLGMTFLVGGVLLLGAASTFLCLMPMVDCPECEANRAGIVTRPTEQTGHMIGPCPTCGGKSKSVPLIKRWTFEPPVQAR